MEQRKSLKSSASSLRILGILFVLPSMLFIAFSMLVPIVWNAAMSLTTWNGMTAVKWTGFANYAKVFEDAVTVRGFIYSLQIAVVSSALAIAAGLLLALAIYKTGPKEGAFYRFVFFSPAMMPFVIIGFLFVFILSPDVGLLNSVLGALGLQNLQHAWLSEPGTVVWTIAVIGGWRFSGLVMILCYTAMTTIPSSMFEAARLEGMGYARQVRMIILPLIMPTVRLVTLLMLILAFKTYDIVFIMTKGGPGDSSRTVPVRMLDVAFQYNEFGYASAIGVLLTILVSLVIVIVQRLARGESYEY
ncbi:carbohydrate ABC transporter permease [Cohnella zeiphila]|uniref:Sugar ABC transporter permease n=1 Tax=Cohnella zeiphila TaxID=2761120 RepID=A0A7X0SLA0_9BACL|nr:sugar ABC transporter permease [Cohnella zeiphila]MBB6732095.1 sugar ABC transporter permease [Cohnella zeiphila]